MELFLQQVFNGIMLGSTYAIVALGLTLVFGILHVPNFAHGNIYMLGAYVAFFLITFYGFGFWVAVIGSMVLMALVGMFMERVVYRPLRGQSHINSFIAAIGAMIFIETFVVSLWGPQAFRIPNPYPETIEMLGIIMSQQRLIVIIAAIVLIVLLQLFIKKTTPGTTIEAVADRKSVV